MIRGTDGLRALLAAALIVLVLGASASAGTVAVRFWSNEGLVLVDRPVPPGMPLPEAAVRALVAGPTQAEMAAGLISRIPAGTAIVRAAISGDTAEIDLSADVLAGLDEAALEAIFDQFRTTLGDFAFISAIRITCDGKLLSSYLAPAPQVGEAAVVGPIVPGAVGLSGKKVCIGPSHGRFWNGGGWYWQRTLTCGFGESVLEDTNSIRLCQFLKQYLSQDGAIVTAPRQLDESDCCHSETGLPWWKMCAQSWLRHIGASTSVWASSSGNTGADSAADRSGDDIRARPLYADSQGSDIYIAHHTNAGGGGTANGTETFRDTSMEHPAWETASYNLANAVQNNVISTIRSTFDGESNWANRGVKDSAGGFGEIRIPNRPAILIELAFHDDCARDASYLIDDFFRSVSEWAIYKGVCQYFGNTPTWDKYSCEYVSDTIPSTLLTNQSYNVSITMRNRGVSWFTSRGFRLGAVGDSDPFASFTRVDISGQVKPGGTYTFNFTLKAPASAGTYTTEWRMVRDAYAWFGPTVSKAINVTANADSQAPTTPTNLRVTAATTSSISLAWDASTDNYGVLGYTIYRNGAAVGTATGTTYTDSGLASNTTYIYQVDAYDGAPNHSPRSLLTQGTTVAIVFQDGFDNLNNWTLDSSVSGNVAPTYTTSQNHGSVAGAGSAYLPAGAAHWVYHDLSSSLSSGGYKTGTLNGWIYDVSGAASGLRTALRAYLYDSTGAWRTIYWIGATNGNPPNIATRYMGAVYNGAWTYYDLGSRSTAWHKLGIEILPYTGSNDLKFYIDGVNTFTASQPPPAADCTVRRIYLGYNYNVNQDSYYDDITFESPTPGRPLNMTGTALSTTSIRWTFTDNANNEIGYRLYNGTTRVAEIETPGTISFDENGLQPNTTYTRAVKAYAGSLESIGTSGTGCTLSIAPSAGSVVCDRTTGAWQNAGPFTFTAVGGFGVGKVDHYLVAWDQQPTHAWSGAESTWSSGTLARTATASASPWYLHVEGCNSAGIANGTLDLGPYYFDNTPPSQPVVTDSGATTGLTFTASWSAVDSESGIEWYEYAIGATPGGIELLGWTAPTPPDAAGFSRSDLAMAANATYYVSAKARNRAQLWSALGNSDGVVLSVPEASVAAAKLLADGAEIRIVGRVVSGTFDGCFYIQELDRSAGIKVVSPANVAGGQVVDIVGRIQGASVERYITATSVR